MRYQLNTIVVGIDFSNSSLHALETAVALARQHKAALHLVHVREEPLNEATAAAGHGYSSPVTKALKDAVIHQFGIDPNLTELSGIPYVEISRYARQQGCSLVVMGSHGWSGRQEGHPGTTAYSVIKHCACPVLLVPSGCSPAPFSRVVFALRPLAGTMRLFNIVRYFLEHDAEVEVLSHPYEWQEANDRSFVVTEAGVHTTANQYQWTQVASFEDTIDSRSLALEASQRQLLVLTPSVGNVSRIGYVAPELAGIINRATMPVLYLANYAFYQGSHMSF